jgi:serine/threonine protein kinase
MKRNMTVWPQGAMNNFKCTVCGVPVGVRGGSLLGIEIHETWPVVAGKNKKTESDPFRSPQGALSRRAELGPAKWMASTKFAEVPRTDVRFIESEAIFEHSIDRPYRARVGCDRVDVWFRHLFPEVTLDMVFDERIIADTKKEASILLALRHPAIISTFGTTISGEGPALLLEPSFCSVASALESGPKSKPFAVRVASQIASAVQYLHGLRIYHNAIAAETVLLLHGSEQNPIAKLSNFSHAKRNDRDSRAAIKDIESLGGFISLLFQSAADELDSAIDDPDCKVGWEALQRYCPKTAPLIRGTPGWDELTAPEIAFEVTRLDAAVEAGSARLAAWLRSAKETKWLV